MAIFEFQESNNWIITANTVEEAMTLWKDYRENGNVADGVELADGSGWYLGPIEEDTDV